MTTGALPVIWSTNNAPLSVLAEADLGGLLVKQFQTGTICTVNNPGSGITPTSWVWIQGLAAGTVAGVSLQIGTDGSWLAFEIGAIGAADVNTIVGAAGTQSLQRIVPASPIAVIVKGYTTPGDGGGGSFYWDAANIATDDGGTIIRPVGVLVGAWIRIFSGSMNIRWFGAKGDGVTDDATPIADAIAVAIASAASSTSVKGSVFIPKGKFVVASELPISSGITLAGEAQPPGGITASPNDASTILFTAAGAGACLFRFTAADGLTKGSGGSVQNLRIVYTGAGVGTVDGIVFESSGLNQVPNWGTIYNCVIEEADTTKPWRWAIRIDGTNNGGIGNFASFISNMEICNVFTHTTHAAGAPTTGGGLKINYGSVFIVNCGFFNGGASGGNVLVTGVNTANPATAQYSTNCQFTGCIVTSTMTIDSAVNTNFVGGSANVITVTDNAETALPAGYVSSNMLLPSRPLTYNPAPGGDALTGYFTYDSGIGDFTIRGSRGLNISGHLTFPANKYLTGAGVRAFGVDGDGAIRIGAFVDAIILVGGPAFSGGAANGEMVLAQGKAIRGSGSASAVAMASVGATNIVTIGSDATGVILKTGATIKGVLSATANLDFPNIIATADAELTINVPGCVTTDAAIANPDTGIEDGLTWDAYVSANDTVTIRLANIGAVAVNPAPRTWRATVVHF